MNVITPGHQYNLTNFEDGTTLQFLQFIHKEPSAGDPSKLVTVNDGTTNEEVLAVLIDRLKFLYNKFPSRETAVAITKIEEALMWLEKRTKDRLARNVEGKHLA